MYKKQQKGSVVITVLLALALSIGGLYVYDTLKNKPKEDLVIINDFSEIELEQESLIDVDIEEGLDLEWQTAVWGSYEFIYPANWEENIQLYSSQGPEFASPVGTSLKPIGQQTPADVITIGGPQSSCGLMHPDAASIYTGRACIYQGELITESVASVLAGLPISTQSTNLEVLEVFQANTEYVQAQLDTVDEDLSYEDLEQLILSQWGVCGDGECSGPDIEMSTDGDQASVVALYNLYDDSTAQQKKEGMANLIEGAWILDDPDVTWRCHVGRGHQDFSTENCF